MRIRRLATYVGLFFIGRKLYRMLMAGQASTASAGGPQVAKAVPTSEFGVGATTKPYSSY